MAFDPVSAAVTAGGSVIGDIIGSIAGANDRAAARRAIERAVAQYGNLPLPVLQQIVAEEVGPSAMEGVHADPGLEEAQYGAEAELGRISDAGGMTLEDRANFEQGQRSAAQRAQGQRQSILNVLQRNGVGGSGASVALQLGAANDQAERAANVGMQTAGEARKRATQAVLDRARLASGQREQQFSEGARRAASRDAVNRYNADARTSVQRYNAQLPQQRFGNEMMLANARANALNGQANYYDRSADRTASQWADRGTGAGSAVAGMIPRTQAPTTTYPGYSQAPERVDEEGYG